MKKYIICGILLLVGCSERDEYSQAVVEQMKSDKDVNDYKIDLKNMARCVVETSSNKMPGLLPIDPDRRQAYKNYAKMLEMSKSNDPQKALEELRQAFGSPKNLADAHSNYAESVVECMSGLVTGAERPQ